MPPLSGESSYNNLCESLNSSLTSFQDVCENLLLNHPLHQESETRKRRKVRFAEGDDVCHTLHKNEMTEHEKQSYWLSYEEIRAIKMDCTGLVGMLEDGMEDLLLFDDDVCLRGLQQYSGEENRRRIATRKQIYKEIFELQALSKSFATLFCYHIAEVSRKGSDKLRQEAIELAKLDAIAVSMLT